MACGIACLLPADNMQCRNSLLYLALLLGLSAPAYALRCGHSLVDLGERKLDVLDKCGEPDTVDQHIETRTQQNGITVGSVYPNENIGVGVDQQHYISVQVVVDEWLYDFGHKRFRQLLRFENGVLTDISEQERVQ